MDQIFRLLVISLFLLFWTIRFYHVKKSPFARKSRKERYESIREGGVIMSFFIFVFFWLYVGWTVLYMLGLPWIDWSYVPLPFEWRIVGLLLLLTSILLVHWAHSTLSTSFSAALEVGEEHKLVTSGPYSRVRHPIYTANTLLNIGIIMMSQNWMLALLFVIALPFTYYRIFEEEAMMRQEHGDAYTDYMRYTGRLIPSLRRRG